MKKKKPNGYGYINKLSGKRNLSYEAKKTIGYDELGRAKTMTLCTVPDKNTGETILVLFNTNPTKFMELKQKFKYAKIPYQYQFIIDGFKELNNYDYFEKLYNDGLMKNITLIPVEGELSDLNTEELKQVSLFQVFDKWLSERNEEVITGTLSKITYYSYQKRMECFKEFYQVPFSRFKKSQWKQVVNSTSVGCHSSLKTVYKQVYAFAVSEGIPAIANFADTLHVSRKPLNPKNELEDKFIHKIWNIWDNLDFTNHTEENQAIILGTGGALILLYTGLRIEGMLNIEKSKIELENRIMYAGNKTMAGKNNVVPIHKRLVPVINILLELSNKKSEYLFNNNKYKHFKPYYFVGNYFKPIMVKINSYHGYNKKGEKLYTTPHYMRHTFISRCSRYDIDKDARKQIMGQSDGDINERYTHKSKQDRINAIDKIPW